MPQPERKMENVPEESTTRKHRKPRKKPEDKPPFFKRHPVLGKVGEVAAGLALATGLACAPAARAHDTTTPTGTTIVQSPDNRVAPAIGGTAPTRPTVVAQATNPNASTYDQVALGSGENRLFDGGGAILDSSQTTPMTQQEFREKIAYMFDLTGQFEILPDSAGRYLTDEFIVKRATSLSDRAPLHSIAVYGRNSLDGGDSREPLDYFASRPEENFRVFRFRVSDSSVVRTEVIAVLGLGGLNLFYFNIPQNKYAGATAGYGPDRFGPTPKIGLEMNEQDGIKYIGAVVADPSKFDGRIPISGAEIASVSLDVSGPNVSERAQLGAAMYNIQ